MRRIGCCIGSTSKVMELTYAGSNLRSIAGTPDAGAFHSVSGHWILGSTGHWPVPSGDSPDGMGRTSPASEDSLILGAALLVPVGGSPTGTGVSPVLPIFKHAL